MSITSTSTRRPRTDAAHPLANRERRTAMNYAFRDRGIPVKVCSRCLVVKGLSAFNRYRTSSDGLHSYCRACNSAAHAYKQATDPEYRQKRRVASLEYNATHVEERRAYRKQRGAKLGAENKAKNAFRVQDPNVLKRCAGRCQRTLPETAFRLDRRTPDGLRIKCRDCADSSRRARQACQMAYGGPTGQACYLCGHVIEASPDVQVDHLIPQSSGGPDTADNVRWTHGRCNRQRFNKQLTAEQLLRAASFGPLPALLTPVTAGE